MASSKWIEVASTGAPTADIAIDALRLRVEKVERMLPLAAFDYEKDVEYVHQLRTSCRRAAAALQSFLPLMSSKPKKLRSLLRKIRTAAGPARDTDVLLERFHVELPEDNNLSYVLARLQLRRSGAQSALVTVAKKANAGRLLKALEEVCQSMSDGLRDEQRSSFRQFGRDAIHVASQKVFQLTAVPKPSIPQLHQLRIAGKRLRYSIELFHEAFPAAMRKEVYPAIEDLQERLGKLNDHATAQTLFQNWLGDMPPGERAAYLAGKIVDEYASAKAVRREFLQWWTTKQVASLESQLSALMHPVLEGHL